MRLMDIYLERKGIFKVDFLSKILPKDICLRIIVGYIVEKSVNTSRMACVYKNSTNFFLKKLPLDLVSTSNSSQCPKPKILSAMQLYHLIFKIYDTNFYRM